MIDAVRNTVLSVLNKDNNGYLSPDQFNDYAHSAQLEIWEQYFHDYSLAVAKRNKHMHQTGFGDVPKRIAEVISRFVVEDALSYDLTNARFNLPSDAYKLEHVVYATGTVPVEVTFQTHAKSLLLRNSLDLRPSTSDPHYIVYNDVTAIAPNSENQIKVYPTSINSANDIVAEYIRFPRKPKWTYVGLSGGEPIFNIGASDYQDFELPTDDFANLVAKICQYAGVQIREAEVVQYMKGEEVQEKQEQNR